MSIQLATSVITELDKWYWEGINVGEAVRKQILPQKLPYVESDDGIDEYGRIKILKKPYCPDCERLSYSGNYCESCGRRLRSGEAEI